MKQGTVYTETVVHSAPEGFAELAPYQLALIEFDDGARELVRIEGPRVAIGDKMSFDEASLPRQRATT